MDPREIAAGKHREDAVDLTRLDDVLGSATIPIAIGMGVGAALGVALWGVRLRWTWSLALLPVAVLVWPIVWQVALAVATCGVSAAAVGARWSADASERRGTEARRAENLLGPLTALTAVFRARKHRASRVGDGRLAIGTSASQAIATIPFGDRQGVRGLVPGAPGAGKTTFLVALAASYIGEGMPVFAIDPKGDPDFREGLRTAAASCGREFVCWSPESGPTYNPLGRGEPSEVADKALAGEEWTEPHYLRQAQRFLGLELQAMHAAGDWPPSLQGVVRNFDPSRLDVLADRCPEELAGRLRAYLDGLSQRARHELSGVRDRLAVLAESSLGPRLEPSTEQIDLADCLRRGAIVYFQLDSDRRPLAAQMLGTALVVDVMTLSGELQGGSLRGLVVIDEFAAIAADEVSRLLSRSRSAGLSIALATQTLADLDLARPGDSAETLRRQVLSHVDYVVCHRQSEPEAAETLAQMAGTKPTWVVTRRVSEGPLAQKPGVREGTRTREREFVAHPDEFKRLGVGEAILIEPTSRRAAERVRIWPVGHAPARSWLRPQWHRTGASSSASVLPSSANSSKRGRRDGNVDRGVKGQCEG